VTNRPRQVPDPAAGSPQYVEARQQIQRHAWNRAQRALEQALQAKADEPAKLDLASVRTVRRAIRRTERWPSDVDAHLDLGRAYFDLDLSEEALAEFDLVQRLAPERYEGYVLAALEYLYRGEYTRALGVWIRARARNPDLPDLDEVMASLPL
jgi:tetratricopeptide (TPR) repeat protein